jgi:hypothetical protein
MSYSECWSITKSGDNCKNKVSSGHFCHLHSIHSKQSTQSRDSNKKFVRKGPPRKASSRIHEEGETVAQMIKKSKNIPKK